MVEESRMTLTVGAKYQAGFEGRRICGENVAGGDIIFKGWGCAKNAVIRPSYNAEDCQALLEEPAIGLWAMGAANEYGVTAGDALELLAYALFLDGQV
jgi:hypothetical protein